MDADGSDQEPLVVTPITSPEWFPAWSPDGRHIAFMGARERQSFDILTVNADGSGEVNLTPTGKTEFGPAWSPDAQRIAYGSNVADGGRDLELVVGRYFIPGDGPTAADDFDIYVMNADGTCPTRLTTSPGVDTDPAYGPGQTHAGAR